MATSPTDLLEALGAEFNDVSLAYAPPAYITAPSVIVIPKSIEPHSAGATPAEAQVREDWDVLAVVGGIDSPQSVIEMREFSMRVAIALSEAGAVWQGADLVTVSDSNNKKFLAWSNPIHFRYPINAITT